MRPAWLPPQSPALTPRDATHARPRSAASSARDTMVQSARQHLEDPPPVCCEVSTVSLQEFKDSFPLVPLSIIPRLSLSDLSECEAALVSLLQSLAVDTNPEDAQLAKYITRQLGLVHRQLEQTRARDRVMRLLNGDETISVEPFAGRSSRPSKSTKALPVFLQPAPSVCDSSSTQSPRRLVVPPLAQAKSTSSLGAKRAESMIQLSKAKAIAKATITTAFVITTSETSMKARQKRAKKKSKEQQEAERAKLQEREKEKRRQAAYQRLMARQALQASKKQKKKDTKGEVNPSSTPPVEIDPSTSFVAANDVNTVDNSDRTGDDSDSCESDVSNCSESDEDDEKAIMKMPVVLKVDNDEVIADDCGVVDSEETDQNQDEDDGCQDERASKNDESEEEFMGESDVPENDADERVEASTRSAVQISTTNEVGLEIDSSDKPEDPYQTHCVQEIDPNCEPQSKDTPVSAREDAEAIERRVREDISRQLQVFMAKRAEVTLSALRSRHEDEYYQVRPNQSRPTTPSKPLRSPEKTIVSELERISDDMRSSRSPTKKRPLQLPEKQLQSKEVSTIQVVPPPIRRDIKDYRSYFSNFFCILTSVFEQKVAFAFTHNGSASTSSLQTTSSANATHASDQALRLQLKLYQGWQTIMNDYATVFGSSIPTPDGLYSSSTTANGSSYTAHYRINSQSRKEVSDIVVTALEKLGDWDEHPSGLGLKTTWNLLWTWSKPSVERKTLLVWQKVNHFQHAKALTRKDCLKKNIGKYQAMGGRLKQAYDIVPASFLLPNEYVAFVQAFHERSKHVPPGKNIWIMKPVALSRGRGISLVNNLADVVYGEQVVIQEYIANPLLLDGFKFDLRLYVLVTSFNPLEVFFYEEGFVRMCTRAYEDSDLTNLFIHLTNSSIQKENQDAIAEDPANPINNAHDDAGGTKMTLAYLWKRLEAMGADVEVVKNDILTVILKALMCGEDHIPYQVNSFDLYGYDILLDTNFRPWLIEINSSPSMARENDLDHQVKDALIYDTLRLVNPLHFDRSKLVDVISRRFRDAETDRKRSHANTRHPKEAEEIATRQLNEDLTDILRGHVPRAYGEMPEYTGAYTRLAPHTTIYNQLVKMKKSCVRPDKR